MGLAEIQAMYNNIYNSKLNDITKKKNQALQDLGTQEKTVNDQWTDFNDTINQKKDEAKQTYYGQRNDTALQSSKNAQQIRDWMAKNNLLQSGESVDGMLRNQTDYNNSMGNIATNENNFNRDITNQWNSASREKGRKLADIVAKRGMADKDYLSDQTALKQEIDAQRMKAEMDFNNAMAAARASSGRSSGGSSGRRSSGSGRIGGIKADSSNSFYDAFTNLVDTGGDTGNVTTGNGVAREILQNNKKEIIRQYGDSFYNKLVSYQFSNQPSWMRSDAVREQQQQQNAYNDISETSAYNKLNRMGGIAR